MISFQPTWHNEKINHFQTILLVVLVVLVLLVVVMVTVTVTPRVIWTRVQKRQRTATATTTLSLDQGSNNISPHHQLQHPTWSNPSPLSKVPLPVPLVRAVAVLPLAEAPARHHPPIHPPSCPYPIISTSTSTSQRTWTQSMNQSNFLLNPCRRN